MAYELRMTIFVRTSWCRITRAEPVAATIADEVSPLDELFFSLDGSTVATADEAFMTAPELLPLKELESLWREANRLLEALTLAGGGSLGALGRGRSRWGHGWVLEPASGRLAVAFRGGEGPRELTYKAA